ncbi:uncharacterized protein L969DRAFT_95613 [Mixia osmundae IAM 14324]|uniref:Uncharacterized protein n=1 Tax=Mixia osmundae (strain CBS 9802 / IAM 14324 / JCM 22182 / KY 12970) TaxID=764103 RepID=G7E7X6_MIXOS|nr:uncharacterized protein L969DRAFT_95613 [Mixia osmundae IAM 14324]KEI38537.1 hypothetical protein L969DRAFT_95613 [Mixia osmundae IAM 14324]GAA98936.1 hypothetical protein E5Q_05624 [Mixia osmundae IAM 14324]
MSTDTARGIDAQKATANFARAAKKDPAVYPLALIIGGIFCVGGYFVTTKWAGEKKPPRADMELINPASRSYRRNYKQETIEQARARVRLSEAPGRTSDLIPLCTHCIYSLSIQKPSLVATLGLMPDRTGLFLYRSALHSPLTSLWAALPASFTSPCHARMRMSFVFDMSVFATPKPATQTTLSLEQIGKANRDAQLDGVLWGTGAGFLTAFIGLRMLKLSRNSSTLAGLLSGVMGGWYISRTTLVSNIAVAEAKEARSRNLRTDGSNPYEGGFGGQETLRDKYASTSGEH